MIEDQVLQQAAYIPENESYKNHHVLTRTLNLVWTGGINSWSDRCFSRPYSIKAPDFKINDIGYNTSKSDAKIKINRGLYASIFHERAW